MKKLLLPTSVILLLTGILAIAQDITNHAMPVGGGPGAVGWKTAGPCASNQALVWASAIVDPTCSTNPIGTVTSISADTGITLTPNPITTTGTVGLTIPVVVTSGGTGLIIGTSGGVPYFNTTTSMASSGLLTTSNPVLGGGAGGTPTSGTRSGNTTVFGTTSGTLTSQHCVKFDANLNLVDNGSNCVSGAIGSFFADPSTGNDSNDCLAATVTGGHGPCLTLQHVMNVAASYDLGGARPVVTLASGTFSVGFVMTGALRGAAFQGTVPGIEINGAGVASTIIDDNTASCGTFVIGEGLTIYAHNVKIQKTSGCGGAGSGVFVQELGYFAFDNVAWGVAGSQQIHVEGNAIVEIVGNYSITGNAPYHWGASAGGSILTDGHTITCNGVTAYSTAFMLAQGASKILMNNGTTFTSCGSVTGQRYQSLSNSVIDADGSTTILATVPGNAAGIQQSGGIYTPASVAIGSVGSVFFQSFGASAINFNSANSDTTITINAPSGYNRYKITSVIISNASQTLTTATVGLFTAAGGGGVAIVTSATAVTVSTASANTNNNMQTLTVNNQNTTSWTLSQLFFRVQTAEGAAATADVQIVIQWVS